MAWNKLLPSDSQKIRELGIVIRPNWEAIEEGDDVGVGNMLQMRSVQLDNRTGLAANDDPITNIGTQYLYSKDDGDAVQEAFFKDSAGNVTQLTKAGKIGATDVDYEAESISFDGTTTYNENNFITHWATVSAAGTIVASSGNLTVALAAGTYTMTFGAAVTNANYGVVATVENLPGNAHTVNYSSKTTTEFLIRQSNQTPSNITDAFTVMVIGAFPA